MPSRLKSYFQLMRLPNAFTAMADPLAGVLVAAGSQFSQLPKAELLALLSVSACLYTAGIIFNDLFDLEEDRRHRPERPLPSGRITPRAARCLAIGLMGVGLLLAGWITLKPLLHYSAKITELLVARPALGLAIALAGLVLSYNYALKHFPVARELGMGFCRAINFALGLTFGFPSD
jgi:4-hydroxybenzoate polyprenyltransferase